MPAEKTAHDLAQENAERERTWQRRAMEVRNALMRECPAGRVLDLDHLVVMLGQQWSSNRVVLLARRFVLSGLIAEGHSDATIHATLGLDHEQARAVLAEVLWWNPPASMLDDLPAAWAARVIHAR